MKKILKSKKELKNNKGITLVALIITVILMLILAGVAISAVIDGDGLFRESRDATKAYENSAKDENKTISDLMNYIEIYLDGKKGIDGENISILTEAIDLANNSADILVIYDENIKLNSESLTNANRFQYKIGGNDWQIAKNGENTLLANIGDTVYARYYDGTNGYNEVSLLIENPIVIGDFVNYNVEVDADGDGTLEMYDKWRILHFNTINSTDEGEEVGKAHTEIVCYNGSDYTLNGQSGYLNSIKLLNEESIKYIDNRYGYATRHLGSDPSNPDSYATIESSNIKANNFNNYTQQTHHDIDVSKIDLFSGDKKLVGGSDNGYTWLASRSGRIEVAGWTIFGQRCIHDTKGLLQRDMVVAGAHTANATCSIAPVISLKNGTKIKIINTHGNGSEGSPWELFGI